MAAALIDFGMACLTDTQAYSTVTDPSFLAPELLGGSPSTIASDIYALGKILKGPGSEPKHEGLRSLVRQMTHKSPADRPPPGQVAFQLRRILDGENFNVEIEAARREVDDVLMDALEREWLLDVLTIYRDTAAFRKAGIQVWCRSTALETASCLNGVFEAWVRSGDGEEATALEALNWPGQSPSLAAVASLSLANPGLRHWANDSVAAVGSIRIAAAHPSTQDERLKRACSHDPNREPLAVCRATLLATATLLDEHVGCEVIRKFIEILTLVR